MKDYVGPPKDFDQQALRAHLERAAHEIKHYTVLFVLMEKTEKQPKRRVGSGIFVNTCGYDGILTAYHVAKPVLENPEFGLCVAEYPHGLFVESQHCQHVPIGHVKNNPTPQNGPDLSFIIIRDANVLATLQSIKSFYHLDTKDLDYFHSPLERMIWYLSGSPYEASKPLGISPDYGPLVMVQNFVGEATFHSRTVREGFDFVNLKVPCDVEPYPKNCEGMSGGGMWLVPLSIEGEDSKTIRHEAPILAGVSFYQSEILDNERIITGHGYDSIYSSVRQALNAMK